MNVQILKTPAGDMVVLPAEDYARLVAAAEDRLDIDDARRALAEMETVGGGMPGAVLSAILEGCNPIAAWRAYRGLSQSALAARAGVAQTAVTRLEKAEPGAGRPATRRAIADALDAPLWTLDA